MVIEKFDVYRIAKIILAILIVMTAFRCEISQTSYDRAKKVIQYKQSLYNNTISAHELSEFIEIWPKYKEFSKEYDIYVPFMQVKPSDSINIKLKLWFTYHNWDVDRFFYVYQRLYSILQIIKIKRDAAELVKQLENRDDELSLNMLELQQRRMSDNGGFSPAEIVLVSSKERLLRSFFE